MNVIDAALRAFNSKCPAKGKVCAKCGGRDHFARKCRTQERKNFGGNTSFSLKREREEGKEPKEQPEIKKTKRDGKVQLIEEQEVNQINDIFAIDDEDEDNTIYCQIGGVSIPIIIDSGSRYNIIDQNSWNTLKQKGVKTFTRETQIDRNFRAYGGQKLIILGKFTAEVKVGNKKEEATFFVIQNGAKCLLGRETAVKLKVLKMGYDVNSIDESGSARFGAVKGVLIEIPLKHEVKPIIQPYRRIPAPLQKAVDDKIKEMLEAGIIERVVGPSKWISPLVVVPKGNDIRICIDMRRANEAVDRENHPLPTIEDFMTELQDARVFSRLDVKNAFHQVANCEVEK